MGSARFLSSCGLLYLCPSAQAFGTPDLYCGSRRIRSHPFRTSVASGVSTSSVSRPLQVFSWTERQHDCGEAHKRLGRTLKSTCVRRRLRLAMISTTLWEDIGKGSVVVVGAHKKKPGFVGLVVKKESDNGRVLFHMRKKKGGATTFVTPRQVRFVVPGGAAYAEADLQTFKVDVNHLRKENELVDVWEELLQENDLGREKDIRWIAGELYGSAEPDPLMCYSTFRMLAKGEGIVRFFRNKKGLYEPRSREEVEALLLGQSREETENSEPADLISRIKKGLAEGGDHAKEPLVGSDFTPVQQEILNALKHLASKARNQFDTGAEDPRDNLGKLVLKGLDRAPTSGNAFLLCCQLGLMSKHENLHIISAGLAKEFPEEIIAEAKKVVENPPVDLDAGSRLDLRHLKTFTIDVEKPDELDDGLSLERVEGGQERVWIHIADVSRWVQEGGRLYREAKRRMTTIYLPDKCVSMFPPELTSGVMSLRAGRVSHALSMGITLGKSGDIVDYTIAPTLVEVDYRLTYADVEEMLASGVADDEEWELGRLSQLGMTRLKYRIQQGSVDRHEQHPKPKIKVTEDPRSEEGVGISISVQDVECSSHRLVSEMMILGGEVVGRLAAERNIPMPYRSQKPPFDPPDEAFLDSFPKKYCRAEVAFTMMSPVTTTIVPGEHWGMGLKSYVQWTSPLRRYMDLLVHYQLKRMLRGEDVIDSGPMLTEVVEGEGVLQAAQSVMRETNRYWTSVYLSRQIGREMEAYVLSRKDKYRIGDKVTYTLLLSGLGLTVPVPEGGHKLQLGETVMAKEFTPRRIWPGEAI